MPLKMTQDDGTEIEVYTAEEVQAQTTTAVKAKEDEFGKTKTQIEQERDEARKALNERTGEFKQFRKLNDEQVAKLSVAERTIYENGLALDKANRDRIEVEEKARQSEIDRIIKTKVGTDEKLFTKVKEMWPLINLETLTPEQIEQKTMAVLGVIGTQQPDLVASVRGFGGGSYTPPKVDEGEGKTFDQTERGKKAMDELGLKIPEVKK